MRLHDQALHSDQSRRDAGLDQDGANAKLALGPGQDRIELALAVRAGDIQRLTPQKLK